MTNKTVDVAVTDLSGVQLDYAFGKLQRETFPRLSTSDEYDDSLRKALSRHFGPTVSIPAVLMDKGE